jgi:hypothetical protein
MVTSRIGIEAAAEAIAPGVSIELFAEELLAQAVKILVIDEAQFATVEQIDDLARLVDDYGIDVHALVSRPTFCSIFFPILLGSLPSPTGPTNCHSRRRVGVARRDGATRALSTASSLARERSS